MIKTLLIRPPELRGTSFAQFYTLHEALGIGYLASYLRSHGYSVEILDAQLEGYDVDATTAAVADKDFQLLGVSVISALAFAPAVEIIQKVKAIRPEVHTAIGGQYPTFVYEAILQKYSSIDTVIRFEGEQTILELAENLYQSDKWKDIRGLAFRRAGRIIVAPIRPLIPSLDDLPLPARDTLPQLLALGGMPAVSTSRGCFGHCAFCSVCAFYGAPQGNIYRARIPKNVLAEIQTLKKDYGCDELWFVDDNFLGPGPAGGKRVRKIFNLLEEHRLKFRRLDFSCRADSVAQMPDTVHLAAKNGAGLVYLGVEAGVQRILELYHKGTSVAQNRQAISTIRESGAELKMEFIFFNPWITFPEVAETISFLGEVHAYDPYILSSILTITRGTPLAHDIEAGHLKVVFPPPEALANFDTDAFIPYLIEDERVRTLFDIISLVLTQFEPALFAVHKIDNLIKMHRKILPEEVLTEYQEIIEDFIALINETSMDLFKESMAFVETGNKTGVRDFRDALVAKTLRFALFLSQLISAKEQELSRHFGESGA